MVCGVIRGLLLAGAGALLVLAGCAPRVVVAPLTVPVARAAGADAVVVAVRPQSGGPGRVEVLRALGSAEANAQARAVDVVVRLPDGRLRAMVRPAALGLAVGAAVPVE